MNRIMYFSDKMFEPLNFDPEAEDDGMIMTETSTNDNMRLLYKDIEVSINNGKRIHTFTTRLYKLTDEENSYLISDRGDMMVLRARNKENYLADHVLPVKRSEKTPLYYIISILYIILVFLLFQYWQYKNQTLVNPVLMIPYLLLAIIPIVYGNGYTHRTVISIVNRYQNWTGTIYHKKMSYDHSKLGIACHNVIFWHEKMQHDKLREILKI